MITKNQLRHGVKASILKELATENAFLVSENQLDSSVLMNVVSKEIFTMAVHDNSDRNEENLSDKFKLSSNINRNLCSQKCNSNATGSCNFPCNSVEEIISYRLMDFGKRLLNYS